MILIFSTFGDMANVQFFFAFDEIDCSLIYEFYHRNRMKVSRSWNNALEISFLHLYSIHLSMIFIWFRYYYFGIFYFLSKSKFDPL